MALTNASYYENMRTVAKEAAEKGRGDIETNFSAALSALTGKSQEALAILTQLEGTPEADPSRWVSTSIGVVQKGVQDVVNTLNDLTQRGGFRGTPGEANIIESFANAITPVTTGLYQEAMKYKGNIGLQKAGLTERLGVGQAGIYTGKGTALAGIGENLSSKLTSIGSQEAAEAAAVEAKKQELANALAIAGKLTGQSTTDQLSKLGVTADLGKILGTTTATGGGAGGISGTGGTDYLALLQGAQNAEDLAKKAQWGGDPMKYSSYSSIASGLRGALNRGVSSQISYRI